MDSIISKLSEVESAAELIVQHAEEQKHILDEQMKEKTKETLIAQLDSCSKRRFYQRPVFYRTLAGALLLVLVFAGSMRAYEIKAEAAYITMEGPVEIGLSVNGKETVISAEGLNEDGESIISQVDVTGMHYQEALQAIMETDSYQECQGDKAKVKVSCHDDEQEADVILVNTCCFINDAKEESVNTILEMAEYKKSGTCKALLVSGCMAQRYKEEILQEVPEVDGILGTTSYDEVSKVLAEALKGERVSDFHDLSELPETKMRSKRLVTTGGHYAFLKISEGCNKRCTYCIIPSLRGPYRSVPMEQLLAEAKELADQGVKELILVAQETTLYGVDLYGEKTLPKLLHELAQIDGIEWIRIQYCYPEEITEELIQAIKTEEKVCHYLDIPIQHASDAVLKRMGRRTNQAELRERIAHLREEIPDIALRTTLISGFPGETQEDHEELMRFVDEMEFDRLGVFAYSAEEDTPAAGYPDQVPQEVKEDRRDEIMELQQEIAFEKAEDMKDRVLEVMIEGKVADENAFVGRTYKDAPNVDGLIFVNADVPLMSGDFCRVRVTGALEYDLIGELADEFTE